MVLWRIGDLRIEECIIASARAFAMREKRWSDPKIELAQGERSRSEPRGRTRPSANYRRSEGLFEGIASIGLIVGRRFRPHPRPPLKDCRSRPCRTSRDKTRPTPI